MNASEAPLVRAARWLTFASCASILVSISISQILLGLSLLALFLSREKLRLPRIQWPLGLFLLGTIVAVLLSGNPAAGMPQVKKFFVFTQLLVTYSLLRDLGMIRWLVVTWAALGSVSALVGFGQFIWKMQRAHALGREFYRFYLERRITGFMSHWYTFSVEEMFALIMLGSLLLFSPLARRERWLWVLMAVMGFAVLLAETRAVWIATAVAALYLIWFWRRWVVALVPLAIVAILVMSPPPLRERFISIVKPSTSDSNEFRVVMTRTGWQMIKAHPWFGLGPEMQRIHFQEYVPADIPRPLPEGAYIHLHNVYLEYAAERGIPVLLVFLWLMGQILWDCARGLRRLQPGPSNRRFLLHGCIAVVLGTLVEGFAEVNLGDSEVLTMFLVVVSCAYFALDKDSAIASPD